MLRGFVLSLAVLVPSLVACGGPGFSLAVADFTIPADSTAGTVCWVEVGNTSPVEVGSATYTASATYRQGDPLLATDDEATIEIFGRSAPPAGACVPQAAGDVELGGPFTLTAGVAQTIHVGEGDAPSELAGLVNEGTFWLGARLVTGFQLGGEQTITFEHGRIRVWF